MIPWIKNIWGAVKGGDGGGRRAKGGGGGRGIERRGTIKKNYEIMKF